MTPLYLFDIDGTLLDAHGSGRPSIDAAMFELYGIADSCAGISFGGKTDPAIIHEIFRARLAREPTDAETLAVLAAYLPQLRQRLVGRVRVHDGVVEALDYLRGRARLGVATGNIRAGADAKLAVAGLLDRFELGGYAENSHVRAELVARAIALAGPVGEVIVIGDTIHDIAGARACGATAIAVTTGSDTAEQLAHAGRGVRVAPRIAGVARRAIQFDKLDGSVTPTSGNPARTVVSIAAISV